MIRSAVAEAVALVLVVLAPSPARADDVEEARRRFLVAEELYARGSYEEAYASYEAAHRAAPLPDFLFNMGQCQRNLGNLRAALVLYRRFLSSSPPEDRREIVEGIVRDILITSPEADTPDPPPDDRARRERTPGRRPPLLARIRPATWIAAGGAVALGGTAAFFAVRAQRGQRELDDLSCEIDIEPCLDARDDARGWFLARNVTLAASGAALGLALVLAIVDAGAPQEPGDDGVSVVPVLRPRVAGVSALGRF